ncbi:coth protein-domain-containing protein [Thamnidium elegans]|nr:coth protein-domain-containing protein [Thamnidium elegans]
MTYISPNDVKNFKNVTISVSGMSTRGMDKLSYKINIPKKKDLFGYLRLKLRAMAMDMSYMRDNLGYAIAESVGLPSTKHIYVRVYINNQAIDFKQGALYVADINVGQGNTTTKPEPSLEKRFELLDGMKNSINSSNIVNGINATSSLSYLGDDVSAYSAGQYSVKEDPSVVTANFTRIMDLTRFISQQPTTLGEKMDVASFLRGLALEVVISNSDGYFDLDLIMGVGMYKPNIIHSGNYFNFSGFNVRILMPRMMQTPQFKQDFEALLVNYTKGLVNPTVLGPHIYQLYDMLSEDVA